MKNDQPAHFKFVQDFAGVPAFSVVNSLMIKRAIVVGLGLLTFCFPLAVQQTSGSEQTEDEAVMLQQLRRTDALDAASVLALYRPEIFSTVDSCALIHDLPVLALLDGQRLPGLSALGRMGTAPLDLPPVASLRVAHVQKANVSPVYGKDSPGDVINSQLNQDYYYGGEVGVLYGRSTGKFGGDVFQTYILGEVGNEKVHITVGAAYEESSGRALRFRSFNP